MKIFLFIALLFTYKLLNASNTDSIPVPLEYTKFKNNLYVDKLERKRNKLEDARNSQLKVYSRVNEVSQMRRNLIENKRDEDFLNRSGVESKIYSSIGKERKIYWFIKV